MYWIYILQSKKNGSLYIGRTNNLRRRLEEHNLGKSYFTKRYKPWVCIYCEGYYHIEDMKQRERNIKYFGKVYSQLKRRIRNSLRSD
ncbi:MAG: GIY-YIG nuclease family protein [Parcubacteria group bacterium]|nr:GIY-YIG nuclease family protein [Parcubacteria group bacterium]